MIVTQNTVEELVTNGTATNSTTTEELIIPKESNKIPSWVRDIFILYAGEDISEDELLAALEYLIDQEIINVNFG